MKYTDLKDFSLILNEEILDKHVRERAEAEVEVMYKRYLDDIKFIIIKHNSVVTGRSKMEWPMIPDYEDRLESWVKNGVIKILSNPNSHEEHGSKYEDLKKIRLNFSETDLKQYVERTTHIAYVKCKNFIKFIVQKHNDMIRSASPESELKDNEILEFWIKKGCIDTKQMSLEHISGDLNPNDPSFMLASELECSGELGAASNKTELWDDL